VENILSKMKEKTPHFKIYWMQQKQRRGKFIAVNDYIKKKRDLKVNNLLYILTKQKKNKLNSKLEEGR
jgi:hypothetical protein